MWLGRYLFPAKSCTGVKIPNQFKHIKSIQNIKLEVRFVLIIKQQVLDESLMHRDNGVAYAPNMIISLKQLPKTTRTYSKVPSLTCHGSVTGVTRKGKPPEGWEILRHRQDGAPGRSPEGKK